MKSKFSAYKEETDIHMSENLVCAGEKLKEYVPSINDTDLQKFVILNGKLYFIGKDDYEIKMAESVGIDTTFSRTDMTVEDMISIVGDILPKKDELGGIPENDKEEAPKEMPGKRLYDKNTVNDTKWDIVIDYDEESNEIGRWGSGYYLLKSGNIEIDGKTVTLTRDYVIDYKTNELTLLSKNYEDWNVNSTLGTTTGLVLNLDPSNFEEYLDENGNLDNSKLNEKNITKYGDVSYDSENKQLLFNIDSNENDEKGYIMLDGGNVSFSKGFTFEFMGTIDKALNTSVNRFRL